MPPGWLAHEYFEDDFRKLADVARPERGFPTLHEATDGDLSHSLAWRRFVQRFGGEQELLVALRTRTGET